MIPHAIIFLVTLSHFATKATPIYCTFIYNYTKHEYKL